MAVYNEIKQRGTLEFPIELYHIDKNHPKYEMASHWHSEIELIRILEGSLNVKLFNNEYIAKAGDVVIVNSETVHGAYALTDCVYECIVLHMELFSVQDSGCRFFIDSILNHEYKIIEYNPMCNDEFHMAINSLFDALKNPSSGYKFRVIGALYEVFGIIVDKHMYSPVSSTAITGDKNVPKLKNVLSFIRGNYGKQITLDDMAKCAGMSPKYFCYFFKEMTRKSPVEYLNLYRIERATRKLINSDASVTDIAYNCGFNDLSYFIKTFKMLKGVTPAKFRKNTGSV